MTQRTGLEAAVDADRDPIVHVPIAYHVLGSETQMSLQTKYQQFCRWCSRPHDGRCPYVKRIEYDPTGETIVAVEFFE